MASSRNGLYEWKHRLIATYGTYLQYEKILTIRLGPENSTPPSGIVLLGRKPEGEQCLIEMHTRATLHQSPQNSLKNNLKNNFKNNFKNNLNNNLKNSPKLPYKHSQLFSLSLFLASSHHDIPHLHHDLLLHLVDSIHDVHIPTTLHSGFLLLHPRPPRSGDLSLCGFHLRVFGFTVYLLYGAIGFSLSATHCDGLASCLFSGVRGEDYPRFWDLSFAGLLGGELELEFWINSVINKIR